LHIGVRHTFAADASLFAAASEAPPSRKMAFVVLDVAIRLSVCRVISQVESQGLTCRVVDKRITR
jgi:hypothetical protein